MIITTVSSRDLNQDVLMTYTEFERLTGQQHNLVDALSMPGLSEIEFTPSRVEIMPREIDLS